MTTHLLQTNSDQLSQLVVDGIREKKGSDVVRLDLTRIHESVADYFVICHANSSTQVRAIADSVEAHVWKTQQENPIRKEGLSAGEWILVDYGDVVVHIFKTEKRSFYNLEQLWGDAEQQFYE